MLALGLVVKHFMSARLSPHVTQILTRYLRGILPDIAIVKYKLFIGPQASHTRKNERALDQQRRVISLPIRPLSFGTLGHLHCLGPPGRFF